MEIRIKEISKKVADGKKSECFTDKKSNHKVKSRQHILQWFHSTVFKTTQVKDHTTDTSIISDLTANI
jgi:hypothetical protein